jgi:hypothetical protein
MACDYPIGIFMACDTPLVSLWLVITQRYQWGNHKT